MSFRINFGESERIFVKHNKCYGQSLVVVGELGIGAQQQAERQLIVPNPDLLATAQVHFYIYSFVHRILILAFLGWCGGFRACCALINHL